MRTTRRGLFAGVAGLFGIRTFGAAAVPAFSGEIGRYEGCKVLDSVVPDYLREVYGEGFWFASLPNLRFDQFAIAPQKSSREAYDSYMERFG